MEALGARLRAVTDDTGSFRAYGTHVVRVEDMATYAHQTEVGDPLGAVLPPSSIADETTPIHDALQAQGKARSANREHIPLHARADVVDLAQARRRLRPGWSLNLDWFKS